MRARGQARAASAWAHALAPGPEELEALREGARLSVSTGTVEWTNKWRVPPERLRRELDFAAHAAAAIERL